MSDSETKKPRRSLKNLPPDRPKVLFIWLAIVAVAAALLVWSPNITESPAIITIQDVVELAETNQIKDRGVIRPDGSGGRDWVSITGKTSEAVLKNDRGAKTSTMGGAFS